MKAWQLKDQALALVGQVCVITAIPQGTEQRCFAGKLMRLGDSMVFLRSTCYNDNAEGCVKHEGPEDALKTLPVAGWTYARIVSLAVHQTEAAQKALNGIKGAANARQTCGRLGTSLKELERYDHDDAPGRWNSAHQGGMRCHSLGETRNCLCRVPHGCSVLNLPTSAITCVLSRRPS